MIKLENGTNADVEVVHNNSGAGWANDIAFDFANATISGTSNTVFATGAYSRVTIFIDGGVTTPRTYLIDNINDGSEATDPNELDVIYTDLVWSDEFDTNGSVNSSNWYHQTQLPAGGSWFNGEQQHYTNRIENSFVENGFLNIVAIKESFTDQNETKQYTSARLNSKFAFTYSRVDVMAKLPFGDGTWPAIWTLGKNVNEDGGFWDSQYGTVGWPACGEIDIMEHGLGATNHVSSALHTPCAGCSGATMNFQSYTLNDVANEFHKYSVNWSPNQITFLIDDVGFYTYNPAVKDNGTWPFYEDQYLLLNIAMGGVAGTIDLNFIESSMVIDYVRVYQNNNLSIDDEFASKFGVYPNPTSDIINIISEENIDNLELYNSIGQLVLHKKKNTKQLNIEDLNSGVYILKYTQGIFLQRKGY
ncbi:family 16 glycosylhydrolase [Winogradskyella sp.]|uniref:family 16 glycosylhydrolase n=1 Tax=Winogradskyella sp. TaxID=1883156 RepID=UPI0025E21AE4|nr:family 16 glycosylhydrolase [Winogradskyella sp.]